MARFPVDETTNPKFVAFNLVFSEGNNLEKITPECIFERLRELGQELPMQQIEVLLHEWYDRGLLTTRGGEYAIDSNFA